ncbi:hypothetical protein [Paraburkholderia sediminicola]|uniref:hypothetical protein n=1 Tax=Paraburkholderia sediminicola TaxID=458836 RepID=UPI0038BDA486
MKQKLARFLVGILVACSALSANAQFVNGQVLTATQLINAFSNTLQLTGGTLTGPLTVPSLSVTGSPIGLASGGTGATTGTGTGSVVLSNSPTITGGNVTALATFGMSSLGSSVHNAYNIGSTLISPYAQLRASSAATTSGTLRANVATDGVDASEFLTYIESNQAATTAPQGATNATTASGNNVLNFASVPTGVVGAMQITDLTNLSAIPSGTTVSSTGSGTVAMSANAAGSGVGSGDTIAFGFPYFKGPAFFAAMASDNMYGSITKFSDGLVSYATIAAGITSGWAEAGVDLAEHTSSGDGTLIGREIDIGPTHSTNSNHCDLITSTVSYCHTNIWLSNTGTVNGSWVMDTGNGGSGWNNGISLRYIASGGTALAVPNNTLLTGATTGGGTVTLAQVDTGNNLQIGANAASANFNTGTVSINGAAGSTRQFQTQTGGVGRWQLRTSNEAESGSNAGSNLNIDRLSDAGAYIDSPVNINRASGLVTLADNLTVPGTMNAGAVQSSGVKLNPVLTGTTSSIGGSALAAGACSTGTVSVAGATTSMGVVATPATYPGAPYYWNGYVSSAGTVTVSVCAAVAGTPTASAYNVRVIQ